MINYPNKKKVVNTKSFSKANMGMALEEMINISNNYYKNRDIAFIMKRPTSVKILKTEDNYHIIDAYFQEASTLDYVGVYKGKYLDFEAKETISKKGFPMANIAKHQIEAMENIIKHGGITFAIIFLKAYGEIYLVDGKEIIEHAKNHKTYISKEEIEKTSTLIKEGYLVPVDYIKVVNDLYL